MFFLQQEAQKRGRPCSRGRWPRRCLTTRSRCSPERTAGQGRDSNDFNDFNQALCVQGKSPQNAKGSESLFIFFPCPAEIRRIPRIFRVYGTAVFNGEEKGFFSNLR